MLVQLSSQELHACEIVAHLRNDPKIGRVVNRRVSTLDDVRINYDHMRAQCAVARVLGVQMDESISLAGNKRGYDLVHDGRRVAVQYNTHPGGDLYVNDLSDFRADLAALVVPSVGDMLRIAGWIEREEFVRLARPVDWGYGQRWAVTQRQLRPMRDLCSPARESNAMQMALL